MTTVEFESLLDRCCEILTSEARTTGFKSSKHFEDRVREVLNDLTVEDDSIEIDFNSPAQAFPDIAMGEYGVEVKYTITDTWRSIANIGEKVYPLSKEYHVGLKRLMSLLVIGNHRKAFSSISMVRCSFYVPRKAKSIKIYRTQLGIRILLLCERGLLYKGITFPV